MTARQGLPDPNRDYSTFPEHEVPAGEGMFRAHHLLRGAWYFDNSGEGRFNLHGGGGTCYTATSVETAVREKVRDVFSTGLVSRALADTFVVSVLRAPVSYWCAAVNAAGAVRHGVVRELVTMDDYTVPQAWAAALEDAGFEGVFYETSFTGGGPSAFALFRAAGAPASDFVAYIHLAGPEACEESGLRVEGPPPSGALELIP